MSLNEKWSDNLFVGPQKFYEYLKRKKYRASKTNAKKYLESSLIYQLHKPTKRRFKRIRVIVSGPNEMLDVDLLDLKDIKGQNYKKRYLLTVVDVFSRKAYACALKDKTANSTGKCFDKLLIENDYFKPRAVRTDHGKLFVCID